MSFNIAMLLKQSADRKPTKAAMMSGKDAGDINYQELYQCACQVAYKLQALGVERGDRVMLVLPNIPEFAMAFFGVAYIGAVNVPVNILFKKSEISFRLKDSAAKVIIVADNYLEEAQKSFEEIDTCKHLILVKQSGKPSHTNEQNIHDFEKLRELATHSNNEMVFTGADDPAVILYTSGTTGIPKGALLSHFSIFYQSILIPLDGKAETGSEDRVGIAHLPFFHVYGLYNVLCTSVALGSTLSLVPRFESGLVLAIIERDKVTDFAGVPTMYNRLFHHPDFQKRDLSSLRFCGSGGAPMPVELAEAWEKATGVKIGEGYGLTETGSGVSTNGVDHVEEKIGSAGKPMWGTEFKILDEAGNRVKQGELGEVVCRSPGMMNGYFNRPDANAESFVGGWLATGDIGYLDEENYLFIVDRKKEMILRGGFNVYPRQIEEILYEHPAVQECAVIGVPHGDLGEEVKAVLYLKENTTCDAEEIKAYCKERMAAYKYPRIVEIRTEELPKSATGKILKRQLKQ